MDFRQLRYFIAVAKHLNFTQAAKELFIVQSAVSRQILELEKQLDLKLFIRDGKEIHLTAAGKVFLVEACAVIARSEEAIEKARLVASGKGGTLKIGFLAAAVVNNLPDWLKSFRHDYPNVTLSVNQVHSWPLTDHLLTGKLDIGFMRSFSTKKIPQITCRMLYQEQICLAVHCDNALASQTSIDLSALANEHFVCLNRQGAPGLFDLAVQLCTNRGFSPRIVNQAQHVETVLIMVDAGIGVAIMPRSYQTFAKPSTHFIDIEGDDTLIDLVVAWNKENSNLSLPLFLETLNRFFDFQPL
ncbi:MAG TPA: LysR family transcriptional regulator [Negativicutes bacterium]